MKYYRLFDALTPEGCFYRWDGQKAEIRDGAGTQWVELHVPIQHYGFDSIEDYLRELQRQLKEAGLSEGEWYEVSEA